MERIWWEQVPNARVFADSIFDAVSEEKNIVVISKNGLPWNEYFFDNLIDRFKQNNSSKGVEKLSDINNPGEFLLRKYCKSEKQAEYRPSKSFAKFFADSEDIVIHDRLFVVRLGDDSLLKPWMTFVAEYAKERGNNKNQASFLIECSTNKVVGSKKGIDVKSLDETIGEYDRFVFCMLASSSVKENGSIKKYLSELISNVIGNNVELCEKIINDYQRFLSSPFSFVCESVDDPSLFLKTEDDVAHDVWLSQVRTIYPALEDYREEFVKKHKNDIARSLPIQSSSGEIYSEPRDVELGTLRFLADKGKIGLSSAEYNKLVLHTQARNDLSHLKSINISEVRSILA